MIFEAVILRVKPVCQADLLTHTCDNPQVVEPFIHILVRREHRKFLVSARVPFPIFPEVSSAHAEYGYRYQSL